MDVRFRSQKTPPATITAAILTGDVDGTIKLISGAKKKELNARDERGFTLLHLAVELRSLKIVDVLLKHPHIIENAKNNLEETPLFWSLTLHCMDDLVIKLIEAGCDVHAPNEEHVTPLHLAVKRRRTEVAQLLIERGADIDAKDDYGYTPLHEAVAAHNYEATCMLLYYGAAANEPCFVYQQTPFMLALETRQEEIQELLFDYIPDFAECDSEGRSIFSQVLSVRSTLCEAIISQCPDLSEFKDIMTSLDLSLGWEDASIFQRIFAGLNHAALLRKRPSFLCSFIHRCCFGAGEFVECLQLVLSSDCAVDFVGGCGVFLPLVQKFTEYRLSESERLPLLYLLFAAGMPVHYFEFSHVYETYGFGREIEAILATRPEVRNDRRDHWGMYLMASIIFYGFTRPVAENALWAMHTDPGLSDEECVRNLNNYLRFFTLRVTFKNNYYYKAWLRERKGLAQKLAERNVGSLVELCRDEIRRIIIFDVMARDAYEVYDAIRRLPIPKVIQDILHLKRPLYL